ncbi:GAF domain-containing protein [Mucilaginibacter myungsuensis]|uniref:GAF domain-containing protein n=1 Tax=Mucilaginibacter myungsuensis TaxID=649104 RepID=A0A929L130_9SPHI|nr:GAF domain-containing protein [Mucilaginibacter myungsuensis]MBE9661321.1 GAF domain-containing protein [Mucilaginibacter myungsuensis]MDN3597464.1 GAF domain-containing protein [Mucilaginibacter myungsuensis]
MTDPRLKEVSRYIDIDLQNDAELQQVLELASVFCKVPVVLVTLLDAETLHFKARKGLDMDTLTCDQYFCSYTIRQAGLMIVPDTLTDDRFKDSPLVVNGQVIRFYAGAPLITSNGLALGSLCILDVEPHALDATQELLLKTLANQVTKAMELSVRLAELARSEQEVEKQKEIIKEASIRLRSFFESSANLHVLLGRGGEVIDYNKTAYRFVKKIHKAKMKRGDLLLQYIAPSFVSTFLDRFHQALDGAKVIEEGSTDYGDAGIVWWEAYFDPAYNDDGEIIGVSYLVRDATERKIKEQKILEQNRSLLKIAHIQAHEYRGPLTTIMGLMNLIKEENYVAPLSYLQFMEQAIDMLDDKIRNVLSNIEEGVTK